MCDVCVRFLKNLQERMDKCTSHDEQITFLATECEFFAREASHVRAAHLKAREAKDVHGSWQTIDELWHATNRLATVSTILSGVSNQDLTNMADTRKALADLAGQKQAADHSIAILELHSPKEPNPKGVN